MDINQYKTEINAISNWKGEIYHIMEFRLNGENNETLKETIEFRKATIDGQDRNFTSGYLDLGLFDGYDDDYRIACICVCMEAEYQRDVNSEIESCSEDSAVSVPCVAL